jgi:hypothetical protein
LVIWVILKFLIHDLVLIRRLVAMASGAKLSKTARASLGKDKDSIQSGKPCPQCTTPMVATRIIKSAGMPGGMYWVCPKDDYRMKT